MIHYVAGLLYNDEGDRVALILKNRPQWQAGLYNAIGGKIEQGESHHQAMAREFREEAGVDLVWDWRFVLEGEGFEVHFFSHYSSSALELVQSQTDEVVDIFSVNRLPYNSIDNIKWIVPLLNDRRIILPQRFQERSTK